jgi:N-acetylglucosamine kinase-like BadF-type ATPase
MELIVGVDGGGTKTLALAASLDGTWQGRGMAGPSNPHAAGFEPACAAIESAIRQALGNSLQPISAICLGLAGAGRAEDVARFTAWARGKFPETALRVTSDAEILLAAGAPEGRALGLICGTGSVAYGRTESGTLLRAGGWGYLFGDEGSGYYIGAAALRAVMQAYDQRGRQTALTGLLLAQRQLEKPDELVKNIYGSEAPRAEIASLAETVETAAGRGDQTALSILEHAAGELAGMIAAVYRGLGGLPAPLALTGGAILRGNCLQANFLRTCAARAITFSQVVAVAEPAAGALKLAESMAKRPGPADR